MIVYLDLIMLSNFIIEFLFLYILEKVYEEKVNYFRMIIASLVGSFLLLLFFLNYIFFTIFKIIGGILIVMIAISSVSKSKQVIKISSFYALNFAFVGFLKSFNINKWYLLILSVVVVLGIFILEVNKRYFIFIKRCNYNVIVDFNGIKIKAKGFLDTGNECFFKETPVVFLNDKYRLKKIEANEKMMISTANGIDIKECFKATSFKIVIGRKVIEKNVFIVFSKIEKECLLNPSILL